MYPKESFQKHNITHLAADGFYSKTCFIDGIMDMNLHQIDRLREDANLRYLNQ
jgi:hypothetical protein